MATTITSPSSTMKIQNINIHIIVLILFIALTLVSSVFSNNIDIEGNRKIALTGRKVRVSPSREASDSSYTSYPRSSSSKNSQDYGTYHRSATYRSSYGRSSVRRKPVTRSEKPNIVVILTDDQDVLLGSLKYMPKVQKHLIQQGVYFNNSFVSTPMCCPSRSTFLTGMYVHNHNVYTNNANCSSTEWQRTYEVRNFATYVNETYNTGYFGKYLNEYDGNHTPPGWHRWVGLIKNSRFYNYSVVDERGVKTKHDDNYYADYLTDLVANDSRAFLHDSKKRDPSKPVMMVLSVPAPHGPEDAAPQYQHMFGNNTDHRTPSWNYAPNPDKQWLLQNVLPMMPQHKIFTDLLQRRRLQTLQSVDDLVENVVKELDLLGELDNTYIIYTSDHGYHLGQFGLIKGKAMPFDFDTRVPLLMRGPGVRPGTIISNIVSNVDIAPTVIDMAGHTIPEHMDGDSMLKLLKAAKDPTNVDKRGFVSTKKSPWRDTVLLERGKLTEKALKQRMRTEEQIIFNHASKDDSMHYYIPSRKRKLALECAKVENRLPCKPQQKWYCIEQNGRLRKHKCRNSKSLNTSVDVNMQNDQPTNGNGCMCHDRRARKLNKDERRRQRRFLKRHVRKNFRPKFLRSRRSTQTYGFPVDGSGSSTGFSGFEAMFNRRCRILANESVQCDLDIYQKASEWQNHKERIDEMIKEYRKALEDLRDIRRHLKEQRPYDAYDDYTDGEEEELEDYGEDGLTGVDGEDCDCEEEEEEETNIDLGRRRKTDIRNTRREDKLEAREKRRLLRRQRRRRKQQDQCNIENMNCFTHDNDHWKTPPYWNYGPFCFCSNANNNTYWCLRTINKTHDFLYCEFITTFMSFYDLKTDPFQLKNTVTELNYGILQQLHEELKELKQCKGSKNCTMNSGQKNLLTDDSVWPGLTRLQQSKRRRFRAGNTNHMRREDDYDEKDSLDNYYSQEWTDETNRELEYDTDYE